MIPPTHLPRRLAAPSCRAEVGRRRKSDEGGGRTQADHPNALKSSQAFSRLNFLTRSHGLRFPSPVSFCVFLRFFSHFCRHPSIVSVPSGKIHAPLCPHPAPTPSLRHSRRPSRAPRILTCSCLLLPT